MAEVYINTYSLVDLEITDGRGNLVDPVGDVSVEIYDYDEFNPESRTLGKIIDYGIASQRFYGASPAIGRFEYELTPVITSVPRNLRLTWFYSLPGDGEGEERSQRKEVFVGTPYVNISVLKEIKELNEYSDQELMAMERLVSKVVDAYCGQTFSFEMNKTKTVMGDGSDYLLLPGRLWELEDVTVLDDYEVVKRDSQGNIIALEYSGRSVLDYVSLDFDNPWRLRNKRTFDYIAINEVRSKNFFKNGNIYAVKGNWGHPFVPLKVSEAAATLIKAYFYDDATYRDRYISDIQAGNWRMKFRSTGDETTGSANADMMLSGYRNINLAVI